LLRGTFVSPGIDGDPPMLFLSTHTILSYSSYLSSADQD
jgi:hypothetical protein